MCAILIKIFFCLSLTSALKLNQDPQFESTDATYDEDCGDRKNYKCWKKGGHSLEKKNAPAPYMARLSSKDDWKCDSDKRVFSLAAFPTPYGCDPPNCNPPDVVSLEICKKKCLAMPTCAAFCYNANTDAWCLGCISEEGLNTTDNAMEAYTKVTPGR